ncbi:arsenate reductase ArsC [Celeribacter sp.]|uniref:arsenate reductase ArsC n=1 Tax=Celeribacter sp. TaxID=1890673 RepID=UPI003A8E4B20
MNILVLCTGNSARSILLESELNAASGGRITAFSAGSQPSGKVHPQSITLLEGLGRDMSTARSKSWDEFAGDDAPQMDAVITVCGSAAAETCPYWPGAPVRSHWGVEDPAAAPQHEWETAFQTAYDILSRRAAALLALPFEDMDTATLKAELDRIGNLP